MLIQTLNNFDLSTSLSSSFPVPMSWISFAGSTAVFNKSTKFITFQLKNSNMRKLTRKNFAQIMKLPVSGTSYEVSTDQVHHLFNEMGHQTVLIGISHFETSSLPCIWSFVFGILLRRLIGRSSGLDKVELEIYSVIVGLYYGLVVDYTTHLWEEFRGTISHTNLTNGVSFARYWRLILKEVYQ